MKNFITSIFNLLIFLSFLFLNTYLIYESTNTFITNDLLLILLVSICNFGLNAMFVSSNPANPAPVFSFYLLMIFLVKGFRFNWFNYEFNSSDRGFNWFNNGFNYLINHIQYYSRG